MINFPYYFFNNFLSQEEIEYVNNEYYNNRGKEDDLGTTWKNVHSWQIKEMPDCPVINRINNVVQYNNSLHFGYELYDKGITTGNLNIYTDDRNDYDWHMDCEPYTHKDDLKITFLMNISKKNYEGGKLQLFPGHIVETPELDIPGNAIIFPSFTPHKVTPVIEGERISFSAWFKGPGFK